MRIYLTFLLLNSFRWLGVLHIISIVVYGRTVLHCGAIHPRTCVHACVCVRTRKNWFLLTKVNLGIWNVERSRPAAWSVFLLLNAPQCFFCICFTEPLNAKNWAGLFYSKHINSSIHPNLTHLSTSWRQLQESKAGKSDPVHIFKLLLQITWHSLVGKNTTCIRMSVPLQLILKFLILSCKGWSLFLFFYFFNQAQFNAQTQKTPQQSGTKQQVATASTLLLTQRTRTTN